MAVHFIAPSDTPRLCLALIVFSLEMDLLQEPANKL